MQDSRHPTPLDDYGYFDQLSNPASSDLRRDTVLNLGEMGVPVKYSHHEAAPSQHEIDLQYTDGLTMADSVMTAKLAIKELAQQRGVYASFMPKPIPGVNGSGMHVHQSLYQGDHNAFYEADDEYYLSTVAKRFIAGLLHHAQEITLVTNQWVNSYKRLVAGYEAPVYVSWAHVNQSDLVRVPAYQQGKESSVRVEYRAPDPRLQPIPDFQRDAGRRDEGHRGGIPGAASGTRKSVRNAGAAAPIPGDQVPSQQFRARRSNWQRTASCSEGALGDHIFNSFIENKKIEWEEYRSTVTDYEISRYLPIL